MKKLTKLFFVFIITLLITCSKDDPTPDPVPQKITYTLTTNTSPSNGGTISPSTGTYNKGQVVTLTATAASEYVFKNWSGGATGTENPITVTFNSNKTITAVFAATTSL